MKLTIPRGTTEMDYQSIAFWKLYDEVEVEEPDGWVIRYDEGGIVHSFGYSQSSGHGEYLSEYVTETFRIPLAFTADAKANAALMQRVSYDGKKAVLAREVTS